MLDTVTNGRGGFISFSQPVARGFPRRVIRLVPNRTFEGWGQAAIEMRDGLFANIRFGFSYNYKRPDTFYFKFPWAFAEAHEKVHALVLLCFEEGLSTSVRGHSVETLRQIPTQELAREILDRLHIEPDGKSRRTARQSLLDDFGVGDVRFWIAAIAPTDEMRSANEKVNVRRLEIDADLYEEHAHVACQIEKTDAHFALLEQRCAELTAAQRADYIERRHETDTLAQRGSLFVGRGSLAGLGGLGEGIGGLTRHLLPPPEARPAPPTPSASLAGVSLTARRLPTPSRTALKTLSLGKTGQRLRFRG